MRKLTYRLLPITILLVLAIRIVIVFDVVPAKAVAERFHQYKNWPTQLRQKTSALPMVFNSSYQKASKYWFYSGQLSLSLNDYRRRRNNYNFWPVEESLFGKPVYVVDPEASYPFIDSLATPIGNVHFALDNSFHSFGKLLFIPEQKEYLIKQNEPLIIKARAEMPPVYVSYLKQNPSASYLIKIGVYDKQKWLMDIDTNTFLGDLLATGVFTKSANIDLPKGSYYLRFAVQSDAGWYTHNSNKIKLTVK